MVQNEVVRTLEWALLMAQLPAQERSSAGVLLLDPTSDELHVRLLPELTEAPEEVAEFWQELSDDLIERSREVGGRQVMDWLETTASHVIQLGSRCSIESTDPRQTLELLYQQHVTGGRETEQPVKQKIRRSATS
jgi:hypothetical protein